MEPHHTIITFNAVLIILVLIILYYVYKINKDMNLGKAAVANMAYYHAHHHQSPYANSQMGQY